MTPDYETKQTKHIRNAAVFLMAAIGTMVFMILTFALCFAVAYLKSIGL